MSGVLALMALAQLASSPAEDEIAVIARKMRLIKGDIKAPRRDGRLVLERCRITRPSGDAELDVVPCAVTQSCFADAPADRKALQHCVEARSQVRLDEIVARRRAAGMGQP
jgi:hypothetical protein